jgi:hypothetical protein
LHADAIFFLPREPGLIEKTGGSEATVLIVVIEEAIAVIDVTENGEDRGRRATDQGRHVAIMKRTRILPAVIIVLESERIDIKDDGMKGTGTEIGAKGGVILGARTMKDPLDVIETSSMTNPAVAVAGIEAILSVEVENERRVRALHQRRKNPLQT